MPSTHTLVVRFPLPLYISLRQKAARTLPLANLSTIVRTYTEHLLSLSDSDFRTLILSTKADIDPIPQPSAYDRARAKAEAKTRKRT